MVFFNILQTCSIQSIFNGSVITQIHRGKLHKNPLNIKDSIKFAVWCLLLNQKI